jgi:hypothetical protein
MLRRVKPFPCHVGTPGFAVDSGVHPRPGFGRSGRLTDGASGFRTPMGVVPTSLAATRRQGLHYVPDLDGDGPIQAARHHHHRARSGPAVRGITPLLSWIPPLVVFES